MQNGWTEAKWKRVKLISGIRKQIFLMLQTPFPQEKEGDTHKRSIFSYEGSSRSYPEAGQYSE